MIIYEALASKDPNTGKMYREWNLPDGMEVPMGYITAPIPEYLKFPTWLPQEGRWGENNDDVVADLAKQLEDAKVQFNQDIMDLMESMSGGVE